MSLARQLRTAGASWLNNCSRLLATQAQPAAGGLPEFFESADLSQGTCNIGLARRRDLTFRQDIRLTLEDGEKKTLKELLKGQKAVVFGVPDCGKVCSEQMVPQYLAEVDNLRRAGITKILCVAVGDAAAAKQWAAGLKVDPSKVEVVADTNGGWTRFLGMELGQPNQPGARSLRYAAVVDDGVLIKLKVDADPAKLDQSSAKSVLQLLQSTHPDGTPL